MMMMMMIITCHDTWVFRYDPETKARMSHSKFKAMLLVFFDIQGDLVAEWVPSGQTVNQHHYIDILIKLCEHVRRKRL